MLTLIFLFLSSGPVLGETEIKIIINKKVNKLAYLKNGEVLQIFPVATGKSVDLTPEGIFKVVRKLVNPYYTKEKIPGGSPKNPLGVRWLGLNARGTPGNTYGIHGNNNPKSIGKYASAGCIRMYNEDVIWLYKNTPVGTPVEIINENWDLEQKPITVMINGNKLPSSVEAKPYMINNRVMVPGRSLAESIGCSVTWDAALHQAILSNDSITVKAAVGLKQITVNDVNIDLDEPVALRNGSLYIPVRAIAEAFGFRVAWDAKTLTVSLVTAN
ncbi:MAG: stalk domain-containing protein [Thermincola sp.]|nr:stalk domain-containing protein [Thermincola sp.]MDT3702796.1 stalk domain-containing protein [Thermincola sp.]